VPVLAVDQHHPGAGGFVLVFVEGRGCGWWWRLTRGCVRWSGEFWGWRLRLRAVEMGDGANVGDARAAAVEGVVDGKEVFGREVADPANLEGLAGAGFDEGGECGGGRSSTCGSFLRPQKLGRCVGPYCWASKWVSM
jgi:hypothetical protein